MTTPAQIPTPDRIMATFESGFVQRYHTHPRLARQGQTNGHHQWGVMTLLIMLHPDPSRALLIEAAAHDTGERFAGDLSYPFKRANPQAAQAHRQTEESFRTNLMQIPAQDLTNEDHAWLEFCDRLETLLWVSIADNAILFTRPWRTARRRLIEAAQDLHIKPQIETLLKTAMSRRGCAELGCEK